MLLGQVSSAGANKVQIRGGRSWVMTEALGRAPPTLRPKDASVTPPNAGQFAHLGFLTVLHEASGFIGGYLVTNLWGRPLEFRLSTAVQPNRVQQILYAQTLARYICGDLISRTLV